MENFVLVVDDSRLARRNAIHILGRLRPDWTCAEASNAEEAMERARAQPVSVSLIDFNMPGQDGISLGEALRALHPRVRIAIVSANIQDSLIARAHALDMAFVPKPLTDDAIDPFLKGAGLLPGRA